MTFVAAAIIGSAAISGIVGASSASKAAKAQTQAADQSAALQREMFDKQTELQAPFREAGLTAQNKLMQYLGLSGAPGDEGYGKYAGDFTMQDFTTDPGYAFRLAEGNKALDRTAAARGGLLSGGAMKAAQRYGQDMGSQEYMNAFNRYQTNRANQLNPLQSLMGAGQTGANTLTQAAGQLGSDLGQNALGAGNARASGYMGQANALTSALGTAVNQYTGMYGGNYGPTNPSLTNSWNAIAAKTPF
jgi:muramidase (phage lysozyme)